MLLTTNCLLQKLHHYGCRGIVNDWFASYLSGRTQFVEIESAKSNILEINCGVPQGSILLGPFLYLLYVNLYRWRPPEVTRSSQSMLRCWKR